MIGLDGSPRVKDCPTILSEWIAFRQQVVKRRLQFRLDKVLDRLHILDGLLVAFLNIDEVIQIIREEDKPKQVMMARFSLSERQAEAILEIKLRQLAKLEEIKIRDEQDALAKERDELEKILNSAARLKTLIKKELKEDLAEHSDERRSPLVEREEARAMREEDMVPAEPVTVILSKKGFVRSAKGHEVAGESLSYKSGDGFLMQAEGKSNALSVFVDSTGKSYSLLTHGLPSARGHGDPLTGKLTIAPGQSFTGVLMGADNDYVLLASDE
jgi:Type IIA topoisomerase (DNA gyrase/topo II, topoisomerase IV), A subunit